MTSSSTNPESNQRNPHKRVTLKDLADHLGLAISTVSRALTDHPRISQKTREKVMIAANELGYERDPMLQALASYRKGIGKAYYQGIIAWVLLDQHTDSFFYQSLKKRYLEVKMEAKHLGYMVEEFRIENNNTKSLVRELKAKGVCGVIFPTQLKPHTRIDIDLSDFPAVSIGETLDSPALNAVNPFQYKNIQILLEKLDSVGYKRIGFWLPRLIDERAQGFFSAGYWHWQRRFPEEKQLKIGLPDEFDKDHFLKWYKTQSPDIIIGIEPYLSPLLRKIGSNACVTFPALLTDFNFKTWAIDENWPRVYEVALLLLDGLIRHRKKGLPTKPRHVYIEGFLTFPK